MFFRRLLGRFFRGFVAGHAQALPFINRGLARAVAFGQQTGADLRCFSRVGERTGDQAQLHPETIVSLLHHDNGLQRCKLLRIALDRAAPDRAQAFDRLGGARSTPNAVR